MALAKMHTEQSHRPDQPAARSRRSTRRARRGTGSVYFAKGVRRWCADFPTGVMRNGRHLRERKFFATKPEAEAELERMAKRHARASAVSRMRLEEYLDCWIETYRHTIRPSTAKAYQGHIDRYINPVLGRIEVGRLTPPDVRRLVVESGRKVKPATVHRIVSTLSAALRTAVQDGSLDANVARNVRLPRADPVLVKAMSPADARAILEAVRDDPLGPLYRLLLGSGMRIGEAIGLDWGDIREDFVVVRTSKTRVRAVPITDDAAQALAELKGRATKTGDADPVFTGARTGRRLNSTGATHHFQRILAAHGLPRMRVHDLRHGVATLMLASGSPMRAISQQLGHSSTTITANTYAHVAPEAQAEALRHALRSVSATPASAPGDIGVAPEREDPR